MLVLGIETTCDETAVAIVRDGKEILCQKIASQIPIHRPFHGVFPEMASRSHIEVILPLLQQLFDESKILPETIDLIAVAQGPGLIGSLLIGLSVAKTLSLAWEKPFVGVNHVEAHLYAAMMDTAPPLPALGVVISGGHTFLVKIEKLGDYELIGTTVDDAIGEAFDKVAKLLGLPYPGGPEIEALAKEGNPKRFPFKGGSVKGKPLSFSFSGLKTNVLYTVRQMGALTEQDKKDVAASFQEAALNDIVEKTGKAIKEFPCKAIVLGGGVSNSARLRALFQEKNRMSLPIFWPPSGLSLDNAAMIAGLGFHTFLKKGKGDPLDLEPFPRVFNRICI